MVSALLVDRTADSSWCPSLLQTDLQQYYTEHVFTYDAQLQVVCAGGLLHMYLMPDIASGEILTLLEALVSTARNHAHMFLLNLPRYNLNEQR